MQTKTCSKCGVEKSIDQFRIGHKQCHQCELDYKKLYREANREEVNQKTRDYHSLNKEREREVHNRYMETHREERARYQKQFRQENKELLSEQERKYRELHKEQYIAWTRFNARKRRARQQQLQENYTKEDEQYTRTLFNNQCANCGSTDKLCIDHHYPLSKGNALTRENAVVLCRSCNASKHIKSPESFYSPEKLLLIESLLAGDFKVSHGLA